MRRQAHRAAIRRCRRTRQPCAAIRVMQIQDLARIDQMRVADLLAVHAPQLGPAIWPLEVLARDCPQRVATAHGVLCGRGGGQFGFGDASLGGSRGLRLLRRRHSALGGVGGTHAEKRYRGNRRQGANVRLARFRGGLHGGLREHRCVTMAHYSMKNRRVVRVPVRRLTAAAVRSSALQQEGYGIQHSSGFFLSHVADSAPDSA